MFNISDHYFKIKHLRDDIRNRGIEFQLISFTILTIFYSNHPLVFPILYYHAKRVRIKMASCFWMWTTNDSPVNILFSLYNYKHININLQYENSDFYMIISFTGYSVKKFTNLVITKTSCFFFFFRILYIF